MIEFVFQFFCPTFLAEEISAHYINYKLFIALYFAYVLSFSFALASLASQKGKNYWLWLVFSIFLNPLAVLCLAMVKADKDYSDQFFIPDSDTGVADELKRLKKMYDEGVIEEEVFKKKQEKYLSYIFQD